MRVECEIAEVELEGDSGMVPGVCATCGRCGHQAEAFGTSGASVRRALVALREDCPEDESNWYVAEDGSHED